MFYVNIAYLSGVTLQTTPNWTIAEHKKQQHIGFYGIKKTLSTESLACINIRIHTNLLFFCRLLFLDHAKRQMPCKLGTEYYRLVLETICNATHNTEHLQNSHGGSDEKENKTSHGRLHFPRAHNHLTCFANCFWICSVSQSCFFVQQGKKRAQAK